MANTAKKVSAPQDELKDVVFEYDGESYTVPTPKLWPLEVVEAQEDGRFNAAIRELLGKEQYKTFRKKPRTLEDLDKITEAVMDAAELDVGE